MVGGPLRSDIWAARERMTHRVGSNREIRKLAENLEEGETVTHLASGVYEGGTGLAALTDRRLLFVRDALTGRVMEIFPFEAITAAQWMSGILLGRIVVFAAGIKSEIIQVQKPDGKALVDALHAAMARERSTVAPVPTPPAPGTLAGVSSFDLLKELRDRGVISPEELGLIANRL
ncbi:hypothetical protein GCM10027294_46320 [Marinactinospora endophytica]